jgi:hypothetical protein
VEDFHVAYPEFQLEDELFPKDGRDVMTDNVYSKRDRALGG